MVNEGGRECRVIPQREDLRAVAVVHEEVIEPVEVQGVSLLEVGEGHEGRPVQLDDREEEALEGPDKGRGISETRRGKLKEEGIIEDGRELEVLRFSAAWLANQDKMLLLFE